jgi:hypothetical protein
VPMITELRQAEKCRHWRKGGMMDLKLEWEQKQKNKGEIILLKKN